ncbi:hypothetical protein QYE76_029544 [Lolium multiflorum]|uniref:CCHC-type domain-containing protein n=1 Tax=Lolium multiflorum TaxID=4521 RepID=A0AAD8VHZ9_LOLMU|nr:hypothetical protein QYE76_029544 [Lolium multiflorum]
MTVSARSSCDAPDRRGRPWSPPLAPSGAPHPVRLPPPPPTLPPNFTPAYLGVPSPSTSRSSALRSVGEVSSAPSLPPAEAGWALPRPRSLAVGRPSLDEPSQLECEAICASLSAWRLAGWPPATASSSTAPAGILRAPSAPGTSAPRGARKSVRFDLTTSFPKISTVNARSSRQAGSSPPPSAALQGPFSAPLEDGWTRVTSRRTRRKARSGAAPLSAYGGRRIPSSTRRGAPPAPSPTSTEARTCYRCSSPDHLVASCSRPRGRRCHPRSPPPTKLQKPRVPVPPPATMSFLGHPTTREEEDSCFIATSYDLDRERLDWESTAIVAWVLAAPSGTDRTDVEDVFRRKFRLRASELLVSSHFPEQFLVKFSSAELRNEVMRTERCNFKLDGLDVHFRPWRAVSHAYNADLHFRVHVVVDGLPPFAWRPEVVDQLVGRKCAVQRLDDGFTTMEDTSSFGMWVWTASPHRIPKVLWCTLVNKGAGGLSSKVRVEEDRPDQWKRGISFRVLLHVDCVEDFTGAPVLDGGEPLTDFRPASHSLPLCHLGTIDGRPVCEGSGSVLPAPIPALGDLGPAYARRHEDDDRHGRRRSATHEERDVRSRSRPRNKDRGAPRRSLSMVPERHRSRSAELKDRRRSRSRHGSRCGSKEARKQRRRDDEDDEDRRGPRRGPSRHTSSRAPRAKAFLSSDGHRSNRGADHSSGRSSGRHGSYHRHSFEQQPPVLGIMASDAQTLPKLASIITGKTSCTDWTTAIKELPPALTFGSSRLATPPPKEHVEAPLPSSWDADVPVASELAPSPLIQATTTTPLLMPAEVPENWDDAPAELANIQTFSAPTAEDLAPPSVDGLFVRPQAPLLPRPTPALPQPLQSEAQPPSETRRSARLVNKPKMHVMDKVVHVLNSKMGIATEGVPLLVARKAYVDKYKSQIPDKTIDALSKLFKLNIRSMSEADEALIAMGGPGGCEPAVQDVIV